jgi:hypothetical protein
MIEFDLPEEHPLVKSLEEMLLWLRGSDIESRIVGDASRCDLSDECLQTRIEQNTANHCRMARFQEEDFDFGDVERFSAQVYEDKTGIQNYIQVPVAKTWYPPGEGYLGWHIDRGGDRIYSAFAEGESFFRYRDPVTKKTVTSYDTPGQWTFRIFTFDADNPMWHCVQAKDLRVSIGYRFEVQG